MKVNVVSNVAPYKFTLNDVPSDCRVSVFKRLCAAQVGAIPFFIKPSYKGSLLDDQLTLDHYGIGHGSTVDVEDTDPRVAPSNGEGSHHYHS